MDFLSLKFFFFYKKRCSYATRKGRTCKICKNFTRALTEIDMPMELSGETKKAGISAGRIGLVLALIVCLGLGAASLIGALGSHIYY